MDQTPEVDFSKGAEASDVGFVDLATESSDAGFVDKIRYAIFGDKGLVKRMIADRSEVKIRRSNTEEWVTGRATKYVQERNTVVVEWEVSGKMKNKEVEIDEFIRWQKGETGEYADDGGF